MCVVAGFFGVFFLFFYQIIYWLEMMRLMVRYALLLFPDTCGWSTIVGLCTPNRCWITVGGDMLPGHCLLARGHWDVCGAFQIKILPSVSNRKWLIEDPKKQVPLKYNWISALYADWIAVPSRWIVVQAGLSHVTLKYVFIVEQFHVSWLAPCSLVLLHLSRFSGCNQVIK